MGSYYTMLYLPLFSHYMLCLCEDILSHLIFIRTKCACAQSLPTLCNPMDYSLPGSSLHGIFQAKILQWVAISYSRGTYLLHLLHWQVDSLPLSHLETSSVATGLEKVSLCSNPKERQYQRMLKLLHNCTHLTR